MIILIIVIAGLYIIFHTKRAAPVPQEEASTSASSTVADASTTLTTKTVAVIGAPSAKATDIVPASVNAPNSASPLVFSTSVTADLQTVMQGQFAATQLLLKTKPQDFDAWIALGGLRKNAGDYKGAAEDWQYMSALYPTNQISFTNLGDLYENYLKDYAKAESNYLISIKNSPSNAAVYRNLYDLYYVYGYNKAKVEAVLKQGIAAAPKAVDMQVLLARYYRDTGRTAEAKAEYSLAIKNAQSQGQTDLATTLQAESSAF